MKGDNEKNFRWLVGDCLSRFKKYI